MSSGLAHRARDVSLTVALVSLIAYTFLVFAAPTLSGPGLSSPQNNTYIRQNTTFNITVDTASNATFYAKNITGSFLLVGTNTSNLTTLTFVYNTTSIPDGVYNISVDVTAHNDTTTNLTVINANITVDNTNPTVAFIAGTQGNNTFVNRSWIFVNVSLTETNLRNITFALFPVGGTANLTNFTTNASTSVNFTNLALNTAYYYNVTVFDLANNTNVTETRYITLSALRVNQTNPFNLGDNLTVTNSSTISYNVTNNDTGTATGLAESFSLAFNSSKAVGFSTNTTKTIYFILPANVTGATFFKSSSIANTDINATLLGSLPSNGGSAAVNVSVGNLTAAANITVTLQATVTPSVYLSSSLNTSDTNISTLANRTINLTFTVPSSTGVGTFAGNVTYSTSVGRAGFAFTANVTEPLVFIRSNYSEQPAESQNGTVYIRANYGRGNVSYNITIENQGLKNLTGIAATYSNTSNFTSGSQIIMFTNTTFPSTIVPNANGNVTLAFDLTSVNHSTDSNYTNVLRLTTNNGQPFGQQNVTLNLYVTNDILLNASVNNSGLNTFAPGTNFTVNVTATYQDGTPVTGLNRSHFFVDDKRIDGSTLTTWNSTVAVFNNTFSNDASGNYWFVIQAYNSTSTQGYGGSHVITIRMTNGTYDGSVEGRYILDAPNIVITYTTLTTSITAGNSHSVVIHAENNGTQHVLTAITLASSNSSSVNITGNTTFTPSTLNAGDTSGKDFTSTIKGMSAGSAYLTASFNGPNASIPYNASKQSSPIIVSGAPSSTNTSAGGGGGGGAAATNSTASVGIVTSDISIVKGTTKEYTFIANNTGKKDLLKSTITLSTPEGWSASWYTVKTQPGDILTGNYANAVVALTVPTTAVVGSTKVTITFSANSGAVTQTKEFSISVLPSQADIQAVNDSLKNVSTDLGSLTQDIETLLSKDPANADALEAKKALDEVNDLIKQANDALASGDSVKAYQLNEQIKQKIQQIQSLLGSAKATVGNSGSSIGWILLLVFLVIGGIAGVVYYMWLPPKEASTPSVGTYRPKTYSSANHGPTPAEKYSELKKKMKEYLEKKKTAAENNEPSYDYQKKGRWQ